MRALRRIGLAAALCCALATACTGSSSPPETPTPSESSAATTSPSAPASAPASIPPAPETYRSPPATLPTGPVALSTEPPPWVPPAITNGGADSKAYIAAAGLPYAEEMLEVHYHAHLDVIIDGEKVTVPPYLGFAVEGGKGVGLAPLHTHDDSGLIHIENSVPAEFVLGQVFIEWGLKFTPKCLGPYCTGDGKELAVFLDGKRYTGDPTRLVFASHQEIAVVYGDAGNLPTPPASYDFPAGN